MPSPAYVALGQKPPSPWTEEDPPDHEHHQKEIKAFLERAKKPSTRLPTKAREKALKEIERIAKEAGVTIQ